MPRILYTLAFSLLMPFMVLRLLWRSIKAPAYRQRMGERFGVFPPPPQTGGIWLHSVSVGETIAAAPLVKALRAQHPELPFCITTTTPTGSDRVKALFGDDVFHVYSPWDSPGCVGRFLNRVQPTLAIVMETEIWPNTIAACYSRRIPTLLANARLSEKSAQGYEDLSVLTRPTLEQITHIAAQAPADAKRFEELGAPRVSVVGNIKFDLQLSADVRENATALKQLCGNRPVWIAASTHPGEEEILLAAHKQLDEDVLLILVPRHPERFDPVAELIGTKGLSYVRRSSGEAPLKHRVWLADTMGELLALLGCADVAFVGGSLIPRGGHNSLEAAAWGIPVITGPSNYNFAEVSQKLNDANGLEIVDNPAELLSLLKLWLGNQETRLEAGQRALNVMKANRGALEKLLALCAQFLATGHTD